MGLAERKQQDAPQVEEEKAPLLDEAALFPDKPLPFREVDFIGADGTEGKLLIQALTLAEIDEAHHIQDQPVRDIQGNVIEEATDIGWHAKIVARAARRPNKTRLAAGNNWLAFSEKIINQWLPGTIKKIAGEVLELSGYGQIVRAQQKKGF